MATRKIPTKVPDELRSEYDLSTLRGGVRGKYLQRTTSSTNIVLLEADVARAFSTDRAVNEALRALIHLAEKQVHASRRSRSKPAS
jgi:hypothetical protein